MILKCNLMEFLYYSKINVLHQMENFLLWKSYFVIVHIFLINGLTMIIICNDESIF
jgi:hypothetical protein